MSFPPTTATGSFPYRIEGQIGSGSMGVVYRAVDTNLDRAVAIKTLREAVLAEEPPETRTEMRQRFVREARAAARLSHPGITVVHHADMEGEVPYMVMEWLDGRTLETLLAERGRLSIGEATHLVVSLLDILEAAHRDGVVHRDIKPANLMILRDGRLKVTDFGIALVAGQDLVQTQAGVILATPRFASPEQLRGDKVDARSDLFSTGVLLYHVLTGAFPFAGKTFLDLANAIMTKPAEPLRQHLPEVPAALEGVVRRALEKSVQERFTSALEMGESLRQFVTGAIDLGSGLQAVPHLGPTEPQDPDAATAYRELFRDLPADPRLAIVRVAQTWEARQLERQDSMKLLERLLETPLHAPAFAGAAVIGDVCLFVDDGVLLGAVDAGTGESGDAVAERIPEQAEATLHVMPRNYPARFLRLLTTVLHPPCRRQSDLDTSIINLPAFAAKLEQEKLDGLVRLVRGSAWGILVFAQGKKALSLFSQGWDEVHIDDSWLSWVAAHPVTAHVEEKVTEPLGFWYRHSLADFELDVRVLPGQDAPAASSTTGSRIREIFRSPKSDSSKGVRLSLHPSDRAASVAGYERSPAYHLLTWILKELPGQFEERGKVSGWRYLADWLTLVHKARLYHHLPRPDSREADFFDLVTEDEGGKVLHVGSRVARSSPEALQSFLDRVLAAKLARSKTGDIGGAFLIAPDLDDDTLTLYNETIQKKSTTGSLLGLEEALTGYEGFVRIGPRRGFHLLLIEEEDEGFVPLIPN